ncbi:MAG: hypothetical protein J6F30_10790 [Cellulosilyticum sp.]|nr:hypothetical protein [Cellulosilyticum sp.]
MQIKKKYIGKYDGPTGEIQYYMLQKDSHYGVELLEGEYPDLTSTIEWFSEDKAHALTLIEMLYQHGASSIHLGELIDNYII